eukprot:GHVN01104930.1.p1 GENE.GHVN01104930.1~~GHVN01104930.1.p1  ORF type:complete len:104 (+),score=14.45 GHVN01104930.1:609-920(+)
MEYGSGQERQVPISQVRKLPETIPPVMKRINWEHLHHFLRRRWISQPRHVELPPAYQLPATPTTTKPNLTTNRPDTQYSGEKNIYLKRIRRDSFISSQEEIDA